MTKEIHLRGRDGSLRGVAVVDDDDYERVGRFRWCLNSNGYAQRRESPTQAVYLHREIVGVTTGDVEVDHINRDRLDNRRANLRVATRGLNAANVRARGGTSRYRGVSFIASEGRWRARAKLDGRAYTLGRFADELDAARAVAAFWEKHLPGFDYWAASTP